MKRTALILAGLALLMAAPASAQYRREGGGAQSGAQSTAPRLSPSQVWSIIQRMTPGRQLNTSLVEGRGIYMVRWQTDDGRRIDYVIDGNSGAVLSRNGG
jgi:uncharacterized membrane protein YkoI